MGEIVIKKLTNYQGKLLETGDRVTVPLKIEQRWIRNGIAQYASDFGIKTIKFDRGPKRKHVHIKDIRDGWIMQKFGDELAGLEDDDIKFTTGRKQDPDADINYYINWTNGKPRLYKLPKSKCDVIMFTHFEQYWECYREEEQIIKWASYFTCMSSKGKKELAERSIPKSKIAIMEGIGTSINFRRKIKIGWAGRPNYITKRKGNDDFLRLSGELDSDMFKFLLYGKTSELLKLAGQMRAAGADVEVIANDYEGFMPQIDDYR